MDIGLQGSYIIALHGTSRDSKLWPTAYWVDLGRQLAQQNLNLALPWANEAEFTRAGEIAKQLQNATVLPKLSIAELAGVIANAQAAVGVDTGLSHLAAALDKPIVAIYTDTTPALTGVMAGMHAQAINPVSYTHLDVYKRQEYQVPHGRACLGRMVASVRGI